jgi:hypothetical protein
MSSVEPLNNYPSHAEFLERAARKRQLLAHLAGCPEVEVVGVVDPGGIIAGWSFGDERWSILVILSPWRDQHGAFHNSDLRIQKVIDEEESNSYQSAIPADSITRFRVQFNIDEDPVNALLVEILGRESGDRELEAALSESLKPVFVEDNDLGRLDRNRRTGWFEGDLTQNGSSIGISFYGEDADGQRKALEVLRALCADLTVLDARAKAYAAGELLTLFNEHWSDDDEPEYSGDDFTKCITLTGVCGYEDGDFDIWYDDGELFCGHAIHVRGNLREGFSVAGIEG